jgi:hypothetical protein
VGTSTFGGSVVALRFCPLQLLSDFVLKGVAS